MGNQFDNKNQNGLSSSEIKELFHLRDLAHDLREENRQLHMDIAAINSSRLYRYFRTTVDGIASRRSPKEIFREYQRIRNREGMIKETDGRHLEYYPAAKHTREEIVQAVHDKTRSISQEEITSLVSLIVLTHNGYHNLVNLFESLERESFYSNYEIIVIDNNSTDITASFLEEKKKKHRLTTIHNDENVSFARGCNQGAACARGEYLVFLNDDITVMENWLDELLRTAKTHSDAAAVGARLIYPQIPDDSLNSGRSYLVQHGGIHFSPEKIANYGWFYRPYNIQGMDALEEPFTEAREIGAVTAACMLINKDVFENIGGFDETYVYGYEDVDICLKAYRKGHMNYYCPSSVLFHHEFGTQKHSGNDEVRERRRNNREYFNKRWHQWLGKRYLEDKVLQAGRFSKDKLTIAFAVTEDGAEAVAGDYFTALELGKALEKYGYCIKFLTRVSHEWYNVGTDTDIIVSMLQHFDPNQVYNASPHIMTVAWARNWFESWLDATYIGDYSVIMASSESACSHMEQRLGRRVYLLPIATNAEQFGKVQSIPFDKRDERVYGCDYSFTGNHFGKSREIEGELAPENIPYRFKIFGKGWDEMEEFTKYSCGHLKYNDIPKVYRYSKVVIDDATPSTKDLGAVNSRVFDALAAGCLVLTNNVQGAAETFQGLLPAFHNRETLQELLITYLGKEQLREEKIKVLQEYVLKNHTYEIRAKEFKNILLDAFLSRGTSVSILICAPNWKEALNWGDYYFATSLKRALEAQGMSANILVIYEWYGEIRSDYVIMLRGISSYVPNAACVNMVWNISHPDDVGSTEFKNYDCVCIASLAQCQKLKKDGVDVSYLPQCTDPTVFAIQSNTNKSTELLFVGNTRGVYRKIIQDLMPTQYQLSVYGNGWEEFLSKDYIKGRFVENNQLASLYQSTCILLNDHWDDMKDNGFASNRIFDALAAATFVISDYVNGIDPEIEECIEMYTEPDDLKNKIQYYLANPEKREEKIQKGRELVLQKHTFQARAKEIISLLKLHSDVVI